MSIKMEDFQDIPSGVNTVELSGSCCSEPSVRYFEHSGMWLGAIWIAIPRGKPTNRQLDIIELIISDEELVDLMATQCGYKAQVLARGRLASLYLASNSPVTKWSQIPSVICTYLEVLSPVPANPSRSRSTHDQQQREPSTAPAQPQADQDATSGSAVTIAGRTFQVFDP